ncbi:hypothetical protein Leryth_000639 [Lithospermum erythrorhizon]|nr:hypothetical protein Leryth_000639 [Lithospermum erythrorhizon]
MFVDHPDDFRCSGVPKMNTSRGVYPVRPPVPAIGGYEGVGEVHSIGSAVKDLSPGDLVIPSPPSSGTWQTYVVKEQTLWHKIEKGTPIEYAASITVNPLTALLMLEDIVNLKSGDSIVQNGATSIVGQCVIQLARLQGIRNINIIRDRPGSDDVKVKLMKLGADEVYTESQLGLKNVKSLLMWHLVCYSTPSNILPLFEEMENNSYCLLVVDIDEDDIPEPSLGFNCVGGNAASLVLKFLRAGGTMVTYGGMSKKPVTVSTSSFIFKELSLRGFWLQKWMCSEKVNDCRNKIDYLLAQVREGNLKYEMEIVPFDEFHTALDKALGKLGSQPKQILRF